MTRIDPDYYNVDPQYHDPGWCPGCEYTFGEDDLAWSDHHQNLVCADCAEHVEEDE
jgi:hypothetical protein